MKKISKISILFVGLMAMSFMSSCNETKKEEDDKPKYEDLVTPPTYEEDSFKIHYYRGDRDFEKWALWLWKYPSGEGQEFAFNGIDEYGAVAAYPMSKFDLQSDSQLGFIVKSAGSWGSKDPDGDRIIDFSKFQKNESKIYDVYLKSGDSSIYVSADWKVADSITKCEFSSFDSIQLATSSNISSYKVYENDIVILEKTLDKAASSLNIKLSNVDVSFEKKYKVEVVFADSKATLSAVVSNQTLYKTDEFVKNYTYEGDDLGVTYSKESSTFKVWSPVSSKVSVRIYDNGTPKSINSTLGNDNYDEYPMVRGEKGVWSYSSNEDLDGKYYTYVVDNYSYSSKEVVDPYAKACGVSGKRGMIVDFEKTNPEDWDDVEPVEIDRKALTVYETHVSDITSSATWGGDSAKAKLFTGAYESGTTYTEGSTTVKTGFDHIKELGVNAVQLVPIYDQANDETNMSFNWGYNPLNYNCLEGGYSSNPYDGYTRIKEFKNLVKEYNDENINIIMDVVYNHVSSAIGSNFDILMPGYYFRYNTTGLSNGSGCGNETASEMPMYRKFMIDSTKFWTKEYKLGGFRFDLMGLEDLETMNLITKECKTINPTICIYGEPWTGGTSTLDSTLSAKQVNGNSYRGYGQFNDQMRDALIKGGLNSKESLGWVDNKESSISTTDLQKLLSGIRGQTVSSEVTINDPNKTVSYVTCHDNYTLYDRFMATGVVSRSEAKLMNVLANAVVFTSQGTTFMQAGEEFMRSKNGDSNSYQSSYATNELNYALKAKNLSAFESYQKLINLKQHLDGLHQDSSTNADINFEQSDSLNLIKYNLRDSFNNLDFVVIHRNGYKADEVQQFDLSGYTLYLDTLDASKVLSEKTSVSAYETIIAYK
jgi:pullulanase